MKKYLEKLLFGLMALVLACESNTDEMNIQQSSEIDVITDQQVLSDRFFEKNENISISGNTGGRSDDPVGLRLTLKAELSSPEIGGIFVMANSISISDDYLGISYNLKGPQRLGAIDIIELQGDNLNLISQIRANSSDISSLKITEDELHFVGNAPHSDSLSFAGKMDVSGGIPDEESFDEIGLGGNVATSLTLSDDNIFVISGAAIENGGGLYKLNNSLEIEKYTALPDARWVGLKGGKVVVLCANPGTVYLLNESNLKVTKSYAVSGLDILESKSTFDIKDTDIYVASGYEGVNIYQLNSGKFIANIPLQEDEVNLVANSVTVGENFGFIAAGKSVFAFALPKNNGNGNDDGNTYRILGQLELGNHQSINEVQFADDYLVVASGLGGTKLIKVEESENEE